MAIFLHDNASVCTLAALAAMKNDGTLMSQQQR
jgi:hypothetical protein